MKVTRVDRYTVELGREDLARLLGGPPPATKCNYSEQVMSPDQFLVAWERRDDDTWSFSDALANGYRILTSGELGKEYKTRHFRAYRREDWPDWVKVLVDNLHPDKQD